MPAGAPAAYAAHSAVPTHEITRPALGTPPNVSPQLSAPVMTKLSQPSSSARPRSSTAIDAAGAGASWSEAR